MERIIVQRLVALSVLLFIGGCSLSPAGLVLIFPSAQDRTEANEATVEALIPGPTDLCPQYLQNLTPTAQAMETTMQVALKNGVATGPITGIPTGSQTLLVTVTGTNGLFLRGCRTGTVDGGDHFDITLQPLQTTVDMAMPVDLGPDMAKPVDMTPAHKTLSITVDELRNASRLLQGAEVTIVDSVGAGPTGATDVNGNVKLDVTSLVPPLMITAVPSPAGSYSGATTVEGLVPVFPVSNTILMHLPVELDPPATAAANTISVTDATAAFVVYYQNLGELPNDLPPTFSSPTGPPLFSSAAGTATVQPLTANVGYRVAVIENSDKIATPGPPVTSGSTATLGTFVAFSTTLALTSTLSANASFTTQKYGVRCVIPGSVGAAETGVPLFTPATPTGSAVNVTVPTTADSVRPGGGVVLETEVVATGASARSEVRQKLSSTTPSAASIGPVLAPPAVSPLPSPTASALPFTITATPPAGLVLANAFISVNIHDAGGLIHWHILAPANSPASVVVPGGILEGQDLLGGRRIHPRLLATRRHPSGEPGRRLFELAPRLSCATYAEHGSFDRRVTANQMKHLVLSLVIAGMAGCHSNKTTVMDAAPGDGGADMAPPDLSATDLGSMPDLVSPPPDPHQPLSLIPAAVPTSVDGGADNYDIHVKAGTQQVLPGPATPIWGFNGMWPGPTINATMGRTVRVTIHNDLPVAENITIHNHGHNVQAAYDGHPSNNTIPQGSQYTYQYQNMQQGGASPDYIGAGTYFYHDHEMGLTAPHFYKGIEGFYLIHPRSDSKEAALNLPSGEYDIPLMIQDRNFDANNNLVYNAPAVVPGFEGSVLVVNGTAHPYLNVATHKYRFRLLNGSNARTLIVGISSGTMKQIGTDGGLLGTTLNVTSLPLAPAERADIVLDFTKNNVGDIVTLTNSDTFSPSLPEILQFRVTSTTTDTSALPIALNAAFQRYSDSTPPNSSPTPRPVVFDINNNEWRMNGHTYDPAQIEFPNIKIGNVEEWVLTNDSATPHPFHQHLVQFQILSVCAANSPGCGAAPALSAQGWKDTVLVASQTQVVIKMKFYYSGPDAFVAGDYVFHCHNLEHEDHAMMLQETVSP